MKRNLLALALSLALGGLAAPAAAGPVILGGDDLTDHGSRAGSTNIEGWLYIEKAIANLYTAQTRPGLISVDIAALGSANPGAGVYTGSNAGSAILSAADALGRTVSFFDGATGINGFFSALGEGGINPAIIWIAGTGARNDLTSSEGAALTTNAVAINNFVGSGGGLMAHGSGPNAYGWLSTLLPGLVETVGLCNEVGATLTPAGQAAFPGLLDSNINQNAGPCHSSFTGNFGGLTTLGLDGDGRSYIIGAAGVGGGSITDPGNGTPGTGVPEPASLALLGIGLLGLAASRRNKFF